MDTFSGFELRELPLDLAFVSRRRSELLERCGIGVDMADFAVGVFDSDDNMVATASLDGDVIKGVAVDPSVRSESLTAPMISAIVSHAAGRNLKVFTKPDYESVFKSLAFTTVGRCDRAVMLTADRLALERHKKYLGSLERHGRVGCIVANANPTTLGHLSLIERAAAEVDTLFVIPLGEDSDGGFTAGERAEMLRAATAHLPGVKVTDPSDYVISRATFPTYFIKKITDVTGAHIALDLDIFATHIAPSLGATVRFVGTEPTDHLTAEYNRVMKSFLPGRGIEVRELERKMSSDRMPISASRVRAAVASGRVGDVYGLVPVTTIPYLLGHAAAAALQNELDLTPKPGLVDRENSGAHDDMDHALMSRSIMALRPAFTALAKLGLENGCHDVASIRLTGVEAERAMFAATQGVNTHRGALFSIGLAVVASASLIADGATVTPHAVVGRIAEMARKFDRPTGTHGAEVARRYSCPTALDAARSGYPDVIASIAEPDSLRLLLRLMSSLDDSNIYHRCGAEVASEVKSTASAALALTGRAELERRVREMDRDFTSRRISPGGAADMLALTLFLRSVTTEKQSHP